MKKIISLILVFAIVFLSGCTSSEKEKEQASKILQEYINNIEDYEFASREFGEEANYIDMDDNMVVAILHPHTDFRTLDKAMENWIEETVKDYKKNLRKNGKKDSTAELTIHYESYVVGKSSVSVKFSGIYSADYLAHPVDVLKTFNFDTDAKDFIELKDIIKFGQRRKFEKYALSKLGISEKAADDEVFSHWLLTGEGIRIFLPKGTYPPSSEDAKDILLKYDEIKQYLRKSFDYKNKNKDLVSVETTKKHEKITQEIDKTKPMIALTFDDGPSAHTSRLLDILKENNAKATFFVIGKSIKGKENTLKRISAEGHEIGNHSWSHRQFTKINKKQITDQLMMTRAKIFDVTGKDCLVARPPYGAVNDTAKAVAKEAGIVYITWSVDTLDWKSKNADAVYKKIVGKVKDGDIVLCHDLHSTTVDAMEKVIPKLIADGYQLVTVSELMEHSPKPVEPGKVYSKKPIKK